MSSTATEKWEQTALEHLVRSPDRGGHAPGGDGEGRAGWGEARSQLLEKCPSLVDARNSGSRCVGTLQRKKGEEGT